MQQLACDVVGCGRPAAWARVANVQKMQEDFLCNHCWANLRVSKLREAACYIPCDYELPESAFTALRDNDEVIYIR